MTMSGNTVTVVLGTYSEENLGTRNTAGGSGTMTWSPTAGLTDFAGNPLAASSATESEQGQSDTDF